MVPVIFLILFLFFIGAIISALLIIGSFIALYRVRVPFAPTPQKNIDRALDLLELRPGSKFYDLGCGDGRVLLAAEKRGAIAIGYEVTPWVSLKARLNLWRTKSTARLIFKNFYHADISDADAVFCFLVKNVMGEVTKKLNTTLRPGARIVTYGFPLTDWQAEKIIALNPENPKASKLYLYVKK